MMHPWRILKTLFVLLLSSFSLSVWAKVEIEGSPELGKINHEQVVLRLKRSVTTQAEVADWLGPSQDYPRCTSPDFRPRAAAVAWTYCWAKYTYRWWRSNRHDHIKKLEITFDGALVVHDFSFEDGMHEVDESGAGMWIPFKFTIFGFPRPQRVIQPEPHTPLTRAVYDRNLTQVEDLLKRGAAPNEPNYEGQTPLSIAARIGSVTLFKLLLEHGASFKHVERLAGGIPYKYVAQQENVMCAAVSRGNIEIVRLLLERGADVNDYVQTTALREAVETGSRDMVELLLAAGADPNVYAQDSDPVLMIAVRHKDSSLVKRLLDAGTRVNDRNHRNSNTALSVAHRLGFTEIEALLKTHGAYYDESKK